MNAKVTIPFTRNLDRAPAGEVKTSVFGCPLFAAECSREGDAACRK